jgi:hypothetical protein
MQQYRLTARQLAGNTTLRVMHKLDLYQRVSRVRTMGALFMLPMLIFIIPEGLMPFMPELMPFMPELMPFMPELMPFMPELMPFMPELMPFMPELMPFICVSWRPAATEGRALSARAFQRTQAG